MFSFGKKKSSSSSQQTSSKFVDKSQQPFLDDIRSQAQDLNNQGLPVEAVASMNPMLNSALNNANASGNMQTSAGAGLMGIGSGATSGTGTALNYANNAMGGTATNGINTAMNTGSRVGNTAAQSSAAFNGGVNMGNVGGMINNDILQGQIDASSRDVMRNLTENGLVNLSSKAAGTGNSGSSRAQNAANQMVRNSSEMVGDIAAAMRGNAYNQALNIGANQATQNTNNQQQTNIANQNAFNNMFTAGMNTGAQQFNQNMQNQQFGATTANNIGTQGVNTMATGQGMMNTGIGMSTGAGETFRDYEKELLNREYNVEMAPYNSLDFYNNIVGAPTVLSEAQGTSKGKSSGFSIGFGSK